MNRSTRAAALASAALYLALAVAPAVSACQVPVFRYALERWGSDPYRLVVFYRGALGAEGSAAVDFVQEHLQSDRTYPNLDMQLVDLDAEPDAFWVELHASNKVEALPAALLFYPESSGADVPFWTGPWTAAAARAIVDSPARRETARRLLKGDSVVWIFLASGNAELDEPARKQLETDLHTTQAAMDLPEGVIPADAGETAGDDPAMLDEPFDPDNLLESAIPLRLAFSLLPVSRDDPAEAVFVRMLMNTESDLASYADQPMTFPVFGRGRSFYSLVGRGMTEDNIWETAAYLCGPCSCQIKEQNPGLDLLFAVNWDAFIAEPIVVDKVLPPLSGVGDLVADAGTPASPALPAASAATPSAPPAPASPFGRNIGIALGCVVGLLALATVGMLRR